MFLNFKQINIYVYKYISHPNTHQPHMRTHLRGIFAYQLCACTCVPHMIASVGYK